ncbi:hypothetical protein ACVW0Y_002978 [Pseudomonas sp. TE3786]
MSTLNDYYRARYLYRLSRGGEAVEASLVAFAESLRPRAELQTVALEDIDSRLQALQRLIDEAQPNALVDTHKAHEILRDLVRVFKVLPKTLKHSWRASLAAWSCNRRMRPHWSLISVA